MAKFKETEIQLGDKITYHIEPNATAMGVVSATGEDYVCLGRNRLVLDCAILDHEPAQKKGPTFNGKPINVGDFVKAQGLEQVMCGTVRAIPSPWQVEIGSVLRHGTVLANEHQIIAHIPKDFWEAPIWRGVEIRIGDCVQFHEHKNGEGYVLLGTVKRINGRMLYGRVTTKGYPPLDFCVSVDELVGHRPIMSAASDVTKKAVKEWAKGHWDVSSPFAPPFAELSQLNSTPPRRPMFMGQEVRKGDRVVVQFPPVASDVGEVTDTRRNLVCVNGNWWSDDLICGVASWAKREKPAHTPATEERGGTLIICPRCGEVAKVVENAPTASEPTTTSERPLADRVAELVRLYGSDWDRAKVGAAKILELLGKK